MEKKKYINSIIFLSIFLILFIGITILFGYLKNNSENNIKTISLIMFIIFLIISISIFIILLINILKVIKLKNIKLKFNSLVFKKLIFYISICTLIILSVLSIIFGFLLTIMPIPQILLILNIVLTTTLNKNIQNEKLIKIIKENKINLNSKEN